MAPRPSHPVAIDVATDAAQVLGDPGKLLQVFTNLLGNAVKYSPGGGIVTVMARREGNQTVVSVTDRGLGISAEDQEKLFGTFFRVRSPETEGISGSGLGLYIVKALVERMGGQVTFQSELGKGSTFFVRLALAPQKTPAATPLLASIPSR